MRVLHAATGSGSSVWTGAWGPGPGAWGLAGRLTPPGAARAAVRQGERDVRAAGRRVVLAAPARDDDELAAVHHVQRRRRVPGGRKGGFPQQAACRLVEHAELVVVRRGADEEQAVGGDHRPAVVVAARVSHALRSQLRILAERNRPANRAPVQ